MPASRAIVSSESRVIPGRIVPLSGGVTRAPSAITNMTFIPLSSSTKRRSQASRNSAWSQPSRTASPCASRLVA